MNNQPPSSEQPAVSSAYPLPGPDIPGRNLLKLKIFSITFLAVAAIGLVYSFAQPATYRSQATLLGASAAALGKIAAVTNAQQIAGQDQVLFSDALLAETRARLAGAGYGSLGIGDIRRQLNATAVEGTNMVEITAQGSNAEVLPRIINAWLDVFLEAQTDAAAANAKPTEQPLPDELVQLDLELRRTRADLEEFRNSHQITSAAWDEQEVNTGLKKLQQSLKLAKLREEKSSSALLQAQQDIARGDSIIPRGESREINQLERELDTLETQLADLDARYTRAFLDLNPKLRVLPEQIEELTAEIARLKTEGSQKVISELREERNDARRTAATMQRQIDDHAQRKEDFASISAEYAARVTALENLEQLNRQTRARLTQAGSLKNDTVPELRLMNRASTPVSSNGADVSQNAIISLSAALAASLFAVWLYGFLNPAHALDPAPRPATNEAETDPQLALALHPVDGEEAVTNPANQPPATDWNQG